MQSQITLPVNEPEAAYILHAVAMLLSREVYGNQELSYVFLNEDLASAFRKLMYEVEEHVVFLKYTPDYDMGNWNGVLDDMLNLARSIEARTSPNPTPPPSTTAPSAPAP